MTAKIVIQTCGGDNGLSKREKESFEKLLTTIERLPDQKMEMLFNMLPHEVNDVKDVLRESGF